MPGASFLARMRIDTIGNLSRLQEPVVRFLLEDFQRCGPERSPEREARLLRSSLPLGLDEPKGQALFEMANLRAAQPRAVRVEVWFQDEARIGQKNSLTRVWGQTGSRPAAPKDLGFASAYVFGAVCPSEGKAAGLIMPICNTLAMNHHLREISSQVAADAHAVVILDRAGWHRSQGLVVPGNITLLELPPYSPGVAFPGLSA